MAFVNTNPIGPRETLDVATVTTAQTDASGSTGTNLVDVKTGATNGSWVRKVTLNANTTVTDGALYFFLYDGSTRTPIGNHVQIPATTVSDTQTPWSGEWIPPDGLLKLPATWKLQVGTRKTETFRLTCFGGDN